MNKKRLIGISCMAAVAAMLIGAGSALASWFVVGKAVNLLSVKGFKTVIQEIYQNPGTILPSQRVSKVVHVKNTGDCDAIVRVKVEVAFGDLDGEGVFRRDESIPGDCVVLHYDTTGLWRRMEDGYFYYSKVLKAGERTEVPLMDSYTLTKNAPNKVKGKQGRIFVYMESIQAEGEAYKTWFEKPVDLSYAYESAASNQEPVKVTFLGVKDGFSFEGESSDIFASFRLLTPGCSRQQRLEVENSSLLSTEIYLSAEPMKGETLSKEERELIEELLKEHVAITLQDKSGELYRGRMDGGRVFASEEEMVSSSSSGKNFSLPSSEKESSLSTSSISSLESVSSQLSSSLVSPFPTISLPSSESNTLPLSMGESLSSASITGAPILLTVTATPAAKAAPFVFPSLTPAPESILPLPLSDQRLASEVHSESESPVSSSSSSSDPASFPTSVLGIPAASGEGEAGKADSQIQGTLEKPIRLGSFLPGQTRHLVLTLAVSPLMDTRYQEVMAKVRWVFSASGGNGEYPNTGDSSHRMSYVILLGTGVFVEVLGLLLKAKRKRRREGK